MRVHVSAAGVWTVILLLWCGTLVLIILAELDSGWGVTGMEQGDVSTPAVADVPPQPEERLASPPLEQFAVIVERPLFHADRRPFVPATRPKAKGPKTPIRKVQRPPAWALVGVVITPQQQFGILWDKTKRRFVRAELGVTVDGWKVAEVSPSRLILTQGQRRHKLELRDYQAGVSPPHPGGSVASARYATKAK